MHGGASTQKKANEANVDKDESRQRACGYSSNYLFAFSVSLKILKIKVKKYAIKWIDFECVCVESTCVHGTTPPPLPSIPGGQALPLRNKLART